MVFAAGRKITQIKTSAPGTTTKRIGNVELTTTVVEMASARIRNVVRRSQIRIRATVRMGTRKPISSAKRIMIVPVMESATTRGVAKNKG